MTMRVDCWTGIYGRSRVHEESAAHSFSASWQCNICVNVPAPLNYTQLQSSALKYLYINPAGDTCGQTTKDILLPQLKMRVQNSMTQEKASGIGRSCERLECLTVGCRTDHPQISMAQENFSMSISWHFIRDLQVL